MHIIETSPGEGFQFLQNKKFDDSITQMSALAGTLDTSRCNCCTPATRSIDTYGFTANGNYRQHSPTPNSQQSLPNTHTYK